ncbi:MAG TPA: glycosyltransferase family 1 protein [Burkholderiaceae bacterium]|nr:glycosyltransferase family 1 protein [Burkholderiaceae bacterium]
MREDAASAIVVDELPADRRSLRIALVTETYPPEVNGVATTIARVVEGLHARHHELQLIRPRQAAEEPADNGGPRFHEILMRGLPIPRYPNLRMGLPATRALKEHWMAHRPDLVHIASEGPLGWSALQAALRLKLPVSSDFRTNFHAYSKHYGIGWLHKPIMAYLRKFHNLAQCTMVPTEELRRSLAEYGFRNLSVVARGVDTKLFAPHRRSEALRQQWGADSETPVVVHVGRLAPEKNLALLLAAFEAMRALNRAAKLVLVGDGPARKWVQARCPDAIFAGMRAGEDLATHYASGDLFFFPSLTETYGNVTAEAMASGLAVLAFDYAAAAQLIRSNDNGMVVPVDDPEQFVECARALANELPRMRSMGARARETTSALGWDSILEQIESTFLATISVGPFLRRAELLRAQVQVR